MGDTYTCKFHAEQRLYEQCNAWHTIDFFSIDSDITPLCDVRAMCHAREDWFS